MAPVMNGTTDLIFVDPSVNAQKFWSATVHGNEMTVHFGRIGSTGQIRTKTLPSVDAAQKTYNKVVYEKLAKGYVYADEPARPQWSSAQIAGAVEELVQIASSTAPRAVSVPEIRPMLAEEIKGDIGPELIRYAADDNVVFQGKVDGHRLMIHITESGLRVLGRAGQDSQHAPRFAQKAYADIQRLENCVLDGELVGDEMWLFDLPFHEGEGITLDSPYRDRHAALERIFAEWAPNDRYRLLPTARDEVAKTQLAVDWLGAGCEGVMIKDLDGAYKPGRRVRTVQKVKFVRDFDAVIIGIGADGHENYVLGLYRDGELVEVGRVSAIGKQKCSTGDVATIRFLYIGADGRLYQPRFLTRRTDKAATECTYDQIAGSAVNKEVLV